MNNTHSTPHHMLSTKDMEVLLSESPKEVKITAEMNSARETIKYLIGEERLIERTKEFVPIFNNICSENNVSPVQAAFQIFKSLEEDKHELLLAIAICTEIISPSINKAK